MRAHHCLYDAGGKDFIENLNPISLKVTTAMRS
jgi:hypothetical protein